MHAEVTIVVAGEIYEQRARIQKLFVQKNLRYDQVNLPIFWYSYGLGGFCIEQRISIPLIHVQPNKTRRSLYENLWMCACRFISTRWYQCGVWHYVCVCVCMIIYIILSSYVYLYFYSIFYYLIFLLLLIIMDCYWLRWISFHYLYIYIYYVLLYIIITVLSIVKFYL